MTPRDVIHDVLVSSEIQFDEPEPGMFVANLPGQRRLKTACWLVVGDHALTIEAFVVRKPDENEAAVHKWLLAHNPKLYGVAWSIDDVGDIYLTGRMSLGAVTSDEIDRVLGVVLEASDNSFNTLLEMGFGSAIRKEWAWRESRGESMANLMQFKDFVGRTS